VEEVVAMSEVETLLIDSEQTRDAIYAGIWSRLCHEMRGHAEGHHLDEYIERFAARRGDPAKLLDYLDKDVGWLTEARRRVRAVEATPLGWTVALDDVRRFMPKAWKLDSDVSGPGEWLYSNHHVEEVERQNPGSVVRVHEQGGDA
jgi:hypothetical protein